MSPFPIHSSQQKIIWLAVVTLLYMMSIVRFDFLQGPPMWDEIHYWQTTLLFSDDLIPTLDNWEQYRELSTPLPFVIFGALEYLFHQGIFGGRLLSLSLFMVIAFAIGWPTDEATREQPYRGKRQTLLCLAGLCLCTSYLALNGRLYTEMITCSFVLLGVASYVKERHVLSGLAFVAAIACRQYMIVFPAAIALYEFILVFTRAEQSPPAAVQSPPYQTWAQHKKWILPAIATLSLLYWVYLFKGLAPAWVLQEDNTPGIQKTIWSIQPGGAIHALASVGGYIVIPELLLFHPIASAKKLLGPRRKIAVIAAILLAYIIIFPPVFEGLGRLIKIALMLPHPALALVLFYGLSLLACIRFSTPTLMSIVVIFQTIIMTKAYPWDKYVLPVAIFFWYLKAYGLEDKGFTTFNQLRATLTRKSQKKSEIVNTQD